MKILYSIPLPSNSFGYNTSIFPTSSVCVWLCERVLASVWSFLAQVPPNLFKYFIIFYNLYSLQLATCKYLFHPNCSCIQIIFGRALEVCSPFHFHFFFIHFPNCSIFIVPLSSQHRTIISQILNEIRSEVLNSGHSTIAYMSVMRLSL